MLVAVRATFLSLTYALAGLLRLQRLTNIHLDLPSISLRFCSLTRWWGESIAGIGSASSPICLRTPWKRIACKPDSIITHPSKGRESTQFQTAGTKRDADSGSAIRPVYAKLLVIVCGSTSSDLTILNGDEKSKPDGHTTALWLNWSSLELWVRQKSSDGQPPPVYFETI